MITLFHGDDSATSRKQFIDSKALFPDAITFDGDSITITDLTQELSNGGLFSEEKHVFIEQLFAKKKVISEREAFIAVLTQHSDASIAIWEGKELDKKTVDSLVHIQNKLYKLPQTLFSLLDSFRPNNTSQLVSLFHQTITVTESELVFFMLIRHIRLLLALSDSSTNIEETKRMSQWQKGKLQKQAKVFSKSKLITLHTKLYEIEKGMKTGSLPLPLSSTIDIFLTEV